MRTIRVLLWMLAVLLALVFMVVVLLQLGPVQQFLAERVTSYLSSKLHTRVSVGRFTTDWSNTIVLKEFYLEDQRQDTLLYAGKLGLDVNIPALFSNQVILKSVTANNAVLNINYTLPDSTANFGFIRNAFTGKSGQAADTVTVFGFRLGKFRLNNVKLTMADAVRGNYIKADIGSLLVGMQQFDSGKAVYKIKGAALSNSTISIIRTNPARNGTKPFLADAGFKNLAVRNVFFKYQHTITDRQLSLRIGNAAIDTDIIDIKNKVVKFKQVSLSDSRISYRQGKALFPDTARVKTAAAGPAPVQLVLMNLQDWTLSLNKLTLAKISLQTASPAKPVLRTGLDFNQLNVAGLSLKMKNLLARNQQVKAELQQLAFRERSGFQVVNAKAAIQVNDREIAIRNLDVSTSQSRLKSAVLLQFPAAGTPTGAAAEPAFSAEISSATISPGDIAFFAPDVAGGPVYQKLEKRPVSIKGRIYGKPGDINAQNVTLKGINSTSATFSGKIRNLTSKTGKEFNVQLNQFKTTRHDLEKILPEGTLPETFKLPEKITVSGGISSKPGKLILNNLTVKASDGSVVQIKGFIHGQTGTDKRLDLEILNLTTTRKALDKMLPPGALAPEIKLPPNIRLTGKIKGPSLNHFNSSGAFETTYGNFQTVFNLQPGQQFSGSVSLQDFNVGRLFSLDPDLSTATGRANFNGTGFKVNTMVLHFDAEIKKITYQKEHFRNVKVAGTLDKSVYAVNGNIRNIVMQGLGHKLKVVKKLKPEGMGVRKIFGRKKKD